MKIKTIIAFAVGVIAMFLLMKSCEGNPKVVTKTVTNKQIEQIKDSIETALLKDIKPVYIDTTKAKIKWLKGEEKTVYRDTTIYKDNPSKNTVESKEYKVTLKSNEASTDLSIIADNLYNIEGVTTFPKVTETIKETTIITRDASGFYIYAQMPISSQLTTPELGIMLQIKNKIIIGVGGQYNNINKNITAVATIAVKL